MEEGLAQRVARECVVTDGSRIVSVEEVPGGGGYDVSWAEILNDAGEMALMADDGMLLDGTALEGAELRRMHAICPDAYAIACHFLARDDADDVVDDLAHPPTDQLDRIAIVSSTACGFSGYAGLADCKERWLIDLAEANDLDVASALLYPTEALRCLQEPDFARLSAGRTCLDAGLLGRPVPEERARAFLSRIQDEIGRVGVPIVRFTGFGYRGDASVIAAPSLPAIVETWGDRFGPDLTERLVSAHDLNGDLVVNARGALATVRVIPFETAREADDIRKWIVEDGDTVEFAPWLFGAYGRRLDIAQATTESALHGHSVL